jgi:serine/threonine protein phosphatase 1
MIVIGDVHGCFNTLMKLLDKIPQSEKDKGIAFCGDLIDRGPRSAQVVEFVKRGGFPCVTGNHEDLMVKNGKSAFGDYTRGTMSSLFSDWLANGGDQAMYSYEGESDELDDRGVPIKTFNLTMFNNHLEWMKNLPALINFPDVKDKDGNNLVISHSSIGGAFEKLEFSEEVSNFQRQDILWCRPNTPKKVKGKFNIFGHTPVKKPIVRDYYANVDTGCFLNGSYNMGNLTAIQFPENIVYSQECVDFDD